jgi:hypothetical protein
MLHLVRMIFRSTLVFSMVFSILITGQAFADELKDEAVSRLANSLEPGVPVALGKAVVRQAALLHARELLAEHGRRAGLGDGWNASAQEWRAAENAMMQDVLDLIDARIESPEWFYSVLQREIANALDGEEADYIATHFTTSVGNEQRIILQMRPVSEVLMTNYTFTGRIDHTVPGLENDLTELQTAYWKFEPLRVRNLMDDPEAIRFAGQDAGLKFTRMLALRGIDGFIRHIDAVAVAARDAIDNAEPLIDDYIVAYRRRVDIGG